MVADRRTTVLSCGSSRRLPPRSRKSSGSSRSCVLLADTPASKPCPIRGYRCRHIQIHRGSRVLKQTFGLCAVVFALALIGSGAALAQAVPPGLYPDAGPALPPHEVITIVRSTGLEPLGRPVRRGPVYTIRAVDPAGGEELRVIVDAQVGNVVRMVPVVMPRGVPVLRPPGRVAMAPDAYGPNARMPMPGAEGPMPGAA